MIDIVISILMLIGASFILVAALGILRFPDLYTRMHAASKASSLGLGCLLAAVAVAYPTPSVIVKCVLVLLFIFLTVPIAAHMIGRAAYLLKVPLWSQTVTDDLKGKYSADRTCLESSAQATPDVDTLGKGSVPTSPLGQ